MRYVDYISLGKHKSPSIRREWIEILLTAAIEPIRKVSLHTEGVD